MMNEAISAEGIAALCPPAARKVAVKVVDETGSTNADLMAALPSLQAPQLLLARHQTAGRGRAGRSWLSEPGKSLTFSLAWKFALPLPGLLGLPLAVGVALAEALDAGVQLKWPNDLLLGGRKLAGILIESARAEQGSWAVIGIGINLALDDAAAERIGRPLASLPQLAATDRNLLMATLLGKLAETLDEFDRAGLAPFIQRWNDLHAYRNQPVRILDNGAVLHEGQAAGIDASGRLLLDTAEGRVAVMAGDISLRPKE